MKGYYCTEGKLVICTSGHDCSKTGLAVQSKCKMGWKCDNAAEPKTTGSSVPANCKPGEYAATEIRCDHCPDGFDCKDPKAIKVCPSGTYADVTTYSECKPCEKGI